MVLELLFIGALQVTAYTNVPEETDSSPNWTSIGEHVHPGGCAVSRDFLESREIKYGDYLYVENWGLCHVDDCMNQRHTKAVDIFVPAKSLEKKVGVKTRRVWKVGKPK